MILFWAICGILLLVALAFILPPLMRRVPPADVSSFKEANLAVYRDQLADMESDFHSGVLAKEQFERDREELERRLLEDVPTDSRVSKAAKPALASIKVTYILAIGLPLAAVLLYLKLGNPNAFLAAALEARERSAAVDPANQWIILAQLYYSLEKYKEAGDAFEKAAALVNTDPDLLLDYAYALSMINGQGLRGKPADLIDRALELNPNSSKALALAGNAAFDAKDYRQAIVYWERLQRTIPSDSELAQPLNQRIAKAKTLANGVSR